MNTSDLDELSSQTDGPSDHPIEGIYEFDWKNKWLKGDEYAHVLQNIESYCRKFNFAKYPKKTHPESIYTDPQNGMIYFVEGNSVGSEFGFPRVEIKKRYRWKKMNFTTDLPKSRPFVTYIVASAVKCEKFFPNSKNEGPSFRMHAVILNQNGMSSYREKINRKEKEASNASTAQTLEKEYILCHIRKIDTDYKVSKSGKRNEEGIEDIENIEEVKENIKPKKLKIETLAPKDSPTPLKQEPLPEPPLPDLSSPMKKPQEFIDHSSRKPPVSPDSFGFRKMGLSLFQMFCVNQVIERDFSRVVHEFCKVPERKKEYHRHFFPEVIHQELNRKETNEVRDYAKMFSLMS